MRLRLATALACAAFLSVSLAGCCCPPTGSSTERTSGSYGGPTLRPGFVRVTRNTGTQTIAFFCTDRFDESKSYWISDTGQVPITAAYPDTLHYHYINEARVSSAEEMCIWYAGAWATYDPGHKFAAPEVTTVHTTMFPPAPCE